MTDEPQGSGKPDIIDRRDAKGKFAKGNTIANLAKRDETGFAQSKDAGVMTWRDPQTGKVHRIAIGIEQLRQVVREQVVKECEADLIARAEAKAVEASRREWSKLVKSFGGDPHELVLAQVSTLAKDGTILQIVQAMADKAASGSVSAMGEFMKLLKEAREWSKGQEGEEEMSESDLAAVRGLADRYEVAEEVEPAE